MMRDLDGLIDARRRRSWLQAEPSPLSAVPAARSGDPDFRDRRMLALHRSDGRSIAQIAVHEGLTERDVRQGIDRALHVEGCILPDSEWERAAPPRRARWVSEPQDMD